MAEPQAHEDDPQLARVSDPAREREPAGSSFSVGDKLTGIRAALTPQRDDPKHVAALKILGLIGLGALLVVLSPLVIAGLATALAAAG